MANLRGDEWLTTGHGGGRIVSLRQVGGDEWLTTGGRKVRGGTIIDLLRVLRGWETGSRWHARSWKLVSATYRAHYGTVCSFMRKLHWVPRTFLWKTCR